MLHSDREKEKQKKTKESKSSAKKDNKEPKDKKTKSTEGNAKGESSLKKEEDKGAIDVKEEDTEMGDGTRKQDTMITRKPEKAPGEPKVASYASRKKAPYVISSIKCCHFSYINTFLYYH